MHLHLRRVHLVLRIILRVLIQVREQDGLRVRGFDVLARAAVAVSTGAYLVVETAVDLVLLRAEDGGEIICHDGVDEFSVVAISAVFLNSWERRVAMCLECGVLSLRRRR